VSMLLVFLGVDGPGISRYSKGFIIAHSGSGSDVRKMTSHGWFSRAGLDCSCM
jgi:hypothetical protein